MRDPSISSQDKSKIRQEVGNSDRLSLVPAYRSNVKATCSGVEFAVSACEHWVNGCEAVQYDEGMETAKRDLLYQLCATVTRPGPKPKTPP